MNSNFHVRLVGFVSAFEIFTDLLFFVLIASHSNTVDPQGKFALLFQHSISGLQYLS